MWCRTRSGTALVAALMLTFMIAPLGSPAAADYAPAPVAFVYDMSSGEVVALDDMPDSDTLKRCGGEAPLEHYCATGERDDVFIHGFSSPFPSAATLESRLIHDDGVLLFRCTYQGGATVNCLITGPQPPFGATVYHDCYAYMPHTAILQIASGPGEPNGVPGGLGAWECLIA